MARGAMVRLERFIDRIFGGFLCFAFWGFGKLLFFKKDLTTTPKNILVVKLWALGESVLTLPMIKSIKQKYPNSKITVIARNKNIHVFENLSFIDNVILFEPGNILVLLRSLRKFDLSIDCEPYLKLSGLLSWFCAKQRIGFSHTIRSWLYTHAVDFNDNQHEVLTYMNMAKVLGINHVPENLEMLSYSFQDKNEVDSLFKSEGVSDSDFVIGFCAGAAEAAKHRLWPAENFARLADKLIEEKNAKIVFVGSSSEKEYVDEIRAMMKHLSINLAGRTSKKSLFYLVEKCDLFVSNDTGPMHVAAAQGTNTVGLFGPNLPARFAPFGKNNVFVEKFLPCRPCINVHRGSFPDCKYAEKDMKGYCMRLISVEDVVKAIERII